jgi:predicted TPR repeat methyltransferase
MLRPFARRLAGIDLSAGMVGKAQALGLYDSLEVADLLSVLDAGEGRWDLLVAADTFPYLGDLEPVFAGAARSLKAGGWFAFTTETADGDNYVLQANGRFAQGPGYIARLAAGRFAVARHASAPIRREAGQPVDGEFFLLRRAPEV